MQSVNPATGELIRQYDEWSSEQLKAALERAQSAFEVWSAQPLSERSARLRRIAEELGRNKTELSTLMTREMGKPITQSEAEIDKCIWVCEYFADNAERLLAPRSVETEARSSYVRFEPLGPILAVMPWNFPFWQVFRFGAPALAAGNVVLLKHASSVQGCAFAIEETLRRAGMAEGVLTALVANEEQAGQLIDNPAIAAVTLTGSVRAGRAVGGQAGRSVKKSVLELGGSDPFIVLADADLDAAVQAAVTSRAINTGQSCIAAKRFIVEASIAERFEQAFVDRFAKLKLGNPLERDTDLGPLAREDLIEVLDQQVRESTRLGAKLILGGSRLERPGSFYPATVLTEVRPGMPAFDQETFGPVAAFSRASDPEQALQLANRSCYGLGASIWTTDLRRAEELARRTQSGYVAINAIVKSDPRLPFGGIKASGYGRELGSFGLHEFVNIKTVWVA
jgi:succinate-semialdehyde dehydrogenase/glutarate-semialdehyde dehydrogenase